jgi:hypothetical protein
MALRDYDRQAVIWCAELAELPQFYDRALVLTQKAADKATALEHDIALSQARMYPDMGEDHAKLLAEMLGKLTGKSRLYICGHGKPGVAPKFVRWDAKTFVALLKKHGLRDAKLVNLVSCELAQDYDPDPDLENFVLPKPNSFASEFHRELKEQEPELLTEVRAYTWLVGEYRPGIKLPSPMDKLPFGSKLATLQRSAPYKWEHKPYGYKISFFWEGGKARRRYMNKEGIIPIADYVEPEKSAD